MQEGNKLPERIVVRFDDLYLTEYSVFKTESLALATEKLSGVNLLLTHLAFAALAAGIREGAYAFSAEDVKFFASFSRAHSLRAGGASVVFYAFKSYPVTTSGDRRLKGLSEFRVEKAPVPDLVGLKMYRTFSSEVNLPLLDKTQRSIVTTEGKNLLVQGIAGSGKTNLCIDKILFAAASGYRGKTLYSTYSRGLLLDVRRKVEDYLLSLKECVKAFEEGKASVDDVSETLAVSRLIGVPLSSSESVKDQLSRIVEYLETKVDYLLLEDIFRKQLGDKPCADEAFFISFLKNSKNYNLLQRRKKFDIVDEVLYKEVYGYIFGKATDGPLTKEKYVSERKGAFTREEAEFVFDLAQDYKAEIVSKGLIDLNLACGAVETPAVPVYSLAVLDEVQDFTEAQLAFFRSIAVKLFCVGDASQMVNPAYFSFARLKDLLYKKDVTDVAELTYNYRNSPEIAGVVAALSDLNRQTFGVHGFVLSAEAVASEEGAFAVAFPAGDFLKRVAKQKTDNFTIVVASGAEKERLRALLPQKEILTVSEIKGLERDTVVLYDVLSVNEDKFRKLTRTEINRKTADENSLYRYYFNLFYVGVSRARRHLFVAEEKAPAQFTAFFKENFQSIGAAEAATKLCETVGSTLVDQEEHKRRAEEFARLGQYDNALHAANNLINDGERKNVVLDVTLWRDYISRGDYVGAGVAYWENGRLKEAKEYFALGGENDLSDLLDAASGGGGEKLDYRILRHYDKFKNNPAAMKIILSLMKRDVESIKEGMKDASRKLKNSK